MTPAGLFLADTPLNCRYTDSEKRLLAKIFCLSRYFLTYRYEYDASQLAFVCTLPVVEIIHFLRSLADGVCYLVCYLNDAGPCLGENRE